MRTLHLMAAAACAAALLAGCSSMGGASASPMGFFITSSNPGQGGDLGGLAGADAHCQRLAASAGAGGKTWRAYLSTPPSGGQPAVHARERIGRGPWANARGVQVAASVLTAFAVGRLQRYARSGFKRLPSEHLDASLALML